MHLVSFLLVATGLVSGPGLVTARNLQQSRRDVTCYYETPAASGDTCQSLASSWGISVELFTKINLGVACPNLQAGKSYCVLGEWTPDQTTATTRASPSPLPQTSTAGTFTTTRSSTITITTSAVPSNSPTMPGIAANCDRFYKIKRVTLVTPLRRVTTPLLSN